jgi:hypothetical protein
MTPKLETLISTAHWARHGNPQGKFFRNAAGATSDLDQNHP